MSYYDNKKDEQHLSYCIGMCVYVDGMIVSYA